MARVQIDAGICGFTTDVEATSEDRQHVKLNVQSPCPNVTKISEELNAEPFDAYQEVVPRGQPGGIYCTKVMDICGKLPHVACPVPSGICKAIEVAAGLALPKDAQIRVTGKT